MTGVTPNSGPMAGGTVLTVTGTYFFITQTLVTIGGTPATDVLVLTPPPSSPPRLPTPPASSTSR